MCRVILRAISANKATETWSHFAADKHTLTKMACTCSTDHSACPLVFWYIWEAVQRPRAFKPISSNFSTKSLVDWPVFFPLLIYCVTDQVLLRLLDLLLLKTFAYNWTSSGQCSIPAAKLLSWLRSWLAVSLRLGFTDLIGIGLRNNYPGF